MPQRTRCPNCDELLVHANTASGVDTYCEECGWPDEIRGRRKLDGSSPTTDKTEVQPRKICETCDGTGKVHSHNPKCWDCNGTGEVSPAEGGRG